MPRPPLKRRRSNQQSPNRARRVPANAGLETQPRLKLQQQLAKKVVGQRAQDSDDSDRLVTRTRHGRQTRNAETLYASGGVAKGDRPGVFPTKQQRSQRLRSETEEILRRSRSKSVEAAKGRLSHSRSHSAGSSNNNNMARPDSPVLQTSAANTMVPASQATPSGENSVLGKLKQRRRQASILHAIDNNDSSSIINPEDEEQFLPDDESTPLKTRQSVTLQPSSDLSKPLLSSVSRKRKLGQDGSPEVTNINQCNKVHSADRDSASRSSSSVSLPPQQSALKRQPLAINDDDNNDDDDVMAPPRSSSPETSPSRTERTAPTKAVRNAHVPSTAQLQSLMPSKRRKGTRERTKQSEFDIPADSDSTGEDDAQDDSIFLPRKRGIRSRGSKVAAATTRPKPGTRAGRTRMNKAVADASLVSASKSKQASKSTSNSFTTTAVTTTTRPVTVTTPRTPLPLTRNANQENKTMTPSAHARRNRHPKLESAHDNNRRVSDDKENAEPTTQPIGKAQSPQPSGGSRKEARQRALRSRPNSDKTRKDNTESGLGVGLGRTRSSRKRLGVDDRPTMVIEARDPSSSVDVVIETDLDEAEQGSDVEVDAVVDNEDTRRESDERVDTVHSPSHYRTPVRSNRQDVLIASSQGNTKKGKEVEVSKGSADMRQWKNKWADIDSWSLDYEEVEARTGSSSPRSLLQVSVV